MSPPHDFQPSRAPGTPRTTPIRRPVNRRPSSARPQSPGQVHPTTPPAATVSPARPPSPEQVHPTTPAAATVSPDNVHHLFGTPPELHVSPPHAVPQETVDDMQLPVETHPITDSPHMDGLTQQVSRQDTRVEELADELQVILVPLAVPSEIKFLFVI